MAVDSFKFLPGILATVYQMSDQRPELPIPWTPLALPLAECTFGLVTSGGLYPRDIEPPFDVEREKAEPSWGDPTYRILPVEIDPTRIGASHLHINPRDVLRDPNILLPVARFKELAADGCIGGLAIEAFSFMGFQGFPPDLRPWVEVYGPAVAERLKAQGANCVLLTTA